MFSDRHVLLLSAASASVKWEIALVDILGTRNLKGKGLEIQYAANGRAAKRPKLKKAILPAAQAEASEILLKSLAKVSCAAVLSVKFGLFTNLGIGSSQPKIGSFQPHAMAR